MSDHVNYLMQFKVLKYESLRKLNYHLVDVKLRKGAIFVRQKEFVILYYGLH